MVNYTLYKNFVFVLPLFIYGAWNRFSSQAYYEIYLLEVFNLIFTAAPIVFYAVLDQEHTKEDLLKYPCLYTPGQKNEHLSVKKFFGYFSYALVQATIIFMVAFYSAA